MSTRTCKGCEEVRSVQVRQLRIYERRRQWQFRLVLCRECFGGLFDLIRLSADGVTEGLWDPVDRQVERLS